MANVMFTAKGWKPSPGWRMDGPVAASTYADPSRQKPDTRGVQRNLMPPPDMVLDNVMALHARGQLDDAVANNPALKRVTDALVTSGHFRREGGRLVANLDPVTGRIKPTKT